MSLQLDFNWNQTQTCRTRPRSLRPEIDKCKQIGSTSMAQLDKMLVCFHWSGCTSLILLVSASITSVLALVRVWFRGSGSEFCRCRSDPGQAATSPVQSDSCNRTHTATRPQLDHNWTTTGPASGTFGHGRAGLVL